MRLEKLLSLFTLASALLVARPAAADVAIGAEAGMSIVTRDLGRDSKIGFGFAGRLGYDIDLSVLHLIPEIKVAFDRSPLVEDVNTLRPMVGVRASIGIMAIAIVGFAHVGYGFPLGASDQVEANGMVYEVGGGIDLTTLPLVDIGIWGAFNSIRRGEPTYDWVSIGAQLTLTI